MGKSQPLGVKRHSGQKFHYTPPTRQTDAQEFDSPPHNLANLFQDRRFGANNPNLDEEQKSLKRFTKERQFLSKRKHRFELEETDGFTLTHKGERLEELPDEYVKGFEGEDGEEEEDEEGELDEEAVEALHFRGNEDQDKTPKERYEEIIAKSKRNKYLHKKEKEDLKILAHDIEKDIPALRQSLKFRDFHPRTELDEYDLLVNELKDQVRVTADSNEGYEAALEAKEKLKSKGKDFNVPDNFEEFRDTMIREDSKLGEFLQDVLIWNSPKLPSQQGKLQVLLGYLLRYMTQENCIPSLISHKFYPQFLSEIHRLCTLYPETASECIHKLLQVQCRNLPNFSAFVDLLGNFFPVNNSSDEDVRKVRESCEKLFLKSSLKEEKQCCWLVFLATVYAKKWLFPGKIIAPEVFGLVRRVLIHTKNANPDRDVGGSLRELVLEPSFHTANKQTLQLLSDLISAYSTASAKGILRRLLLYADCPILEKHFSNTFNSLTSEVYIQTTKVQEIPSYEPLIQDKITTLHKNKDLKKELTETDKLKREVKTAQKDAKKALQRQSFAEELRKQEQNRVLKASKERKGNQARSALDDLQSEYKRMVTSQGELRKKKARRSRMGGYRMEERGPEDS